MQMWTHRKLIKEGFQHYNLMKSKGFLVVPRTGLEPVQPKAEGF